MMQKGRIIVCGDAGEAVGDSMYEGSIYVAGEVASLGADATVEEVGRGRADGRPGGTLERYGVDKRLRLHQNRVGQEAVPLRLPGTAGKGPDLILMPGPRTLARQEERPYMVMSNSQLWPPWVLEDIHAKAELGRYRIRGFSTFQKVTHFDDLTFPVHRAHPLPPGRVQGALQHPDGHRRPARREPPGPGDAGLHQRHELRRPVRQRQDGAGQGRGHGGLRKLHRRRRDAAVGAGRRRRS